MEKKDLRVVFLGSNDFAKEILEGIIKEGFKVVGIVTTPTHRVRTRGKEEVIQSPLLGYDIPTITPENLEEIVPFVEETGGNVGIVVSYKILPDVVLEAFEYKIFNVHPSLLPKYRGAAPIHWAIINGEEWTGTTTFFLTNGLDKGDIIEQKKLAILKGEKFDTIYNNLLELSKEITLKTLEKLIEYNGRPPLLRQEGPTCYAPKLCHANTQIDWSWSREKIYNLLRAVGSRAWGILAQKEVKIIAAEPKDEKIDSGKMIYRRGKVYVGCGDGSIVLEKVQPAGKKIMNAIDFYNGTV